MSRYRRAHHKGGTYFFTLNTLRRQPLLTLPKVRAALRESIDRTREQYPFEILAWVLLPDHLHCVWRLPTGDANFGVRWSLIKRHVTQATTLDKPGIGPSESCAARREGALWQRRFWEHLIRDEDDFRRYVDYIHWNPVKHGLVNAVAEWPYSTFHRYVNERFIRWTGVEFQRVAVRDSERTRAHSAPYGCFPRNRRRSIQQGNRL